MIIGIVGCFLPIIPGPSLNFIGVLLLQLKTNPPFSTNFLLLWGLITLLVTVLDYIIPIYGTKRFGGSKSGIVGSMIGLIVGVFFFPPLGIIIGPLVGALLGEFYAGKSSNKAVRSALGSFLGFVLGTLTKLIISVILTFYFFVNAF